MKSTITKLYDYKQSVIPEELRRWRAQDEEIQAQLETLSRNHAFEAEAEEVQSGDSVACRGESGAERWNRETLLFYPGRGLCAAELENACVGAKTGESRVVRTEEGEVTLTVKRIVRRSNMPISDGLVKLENIEGVETVEDYRRWFRNQREDFYRQRAIYQMANFLLDEVQKNSVLSIDQEEKSTWLWDRVNSLYEAFMAAGIDPKIPEDGFDFLTEEQAKEKMYRESEPFFDACVVQAFMAEELSGQSIADICQAGLEKLAAEHGTTAEALRATSSEAMICGKFAAEKAMELLGPYTEQFLEA